MAKVMICVPTMDKVDASFFASVLGLRYDGAHRYAWNVKSNSMIYDARNEFALEAINGRFDYLVFLDSDLVVEPDTVIRLVEDIEQSGADLVTGIYFKRRLPTAPVIYRHIDWYEDDVLGAQESAEVYEDWPENGGLFDVEGCGMGCCVIRVSMLPEVVAAFRISPFTPLPRLSEDLSFCWRLKKLRKRMVCDPGILPLHAGLKLYGEADWDRQREAEG